MQDTITATSSAAEHEPTQTPEVSVILSVYNAQAYLAEAVDSVLAQTLTGFEFIIIDDGSEDGSGGILEGYARSDPRIRLVRRENRGLTVSLNEGLGMARSGMIARMDADDIAEPERLAKQLAFMQDNPGVSAVGCAVQTINKQGQPGPVVRFPTGHGQIEAQLWRGHGFVICHPALMARREAIERIGGYDARYRTAQDLDLYLRLGEVGELSNLEDVLLRYRRHPGAVGVSNFEQQDRDVWNMLHAAMSRRGIKRRPKGFYEARWEVRRNMAIHFGAEGRYAAALKQAIVACRYKPVSVRSACSLVIALLGPWAARRWHKRGGSNTESQAG